MQLTVASYNIHKAMGGDRRRDPDRIMAVLHEVDADIVALQEVDRRFGRRQSVIPRHLVDDHGRYQVVAPGTRAESMGWHGNALLVRRGIAIERASGLVLPSLEPRGAVCADLRIDGRALRVVGMHLDLSGIRRRQQLRAVIAHCAERGRGQSAVLMGDFNEWSLRLGALGEFGAGWRVLAPGRSFPARRPVAQLDRIVVSDGCQVVEAGVHHSMLATLASDHLPVRARLQLLGG